MRNYTIILLALTLFTSNAFAKRLAPKEVDQVVYQNKFLITAPDFASLYQGMPHNGGYLLVRDYKTKKRICLHEVYKVNYIKGLETDVQDVFIKRMELKGEFLIVDNEKKERFKIPIDYLCKK